MPLPVSHALAGATLWAALDRDAGARPLPRGAVGRLALAVLLANAADLDLVPGLLVGEPNRFHHTGSHSLTAAWSRARRWPGWPLSSRRLGGSAATAAMVVALLCSHVVLDLLTHDPSPPHGVPALWPLTTARLQGPAWFARGDKLPGPAGALAFAASMLSLHNLRAAARELLLLGPPLLLVLAWRRLRAARARNAGRAAGG